MFNIYALVKMNPEGRPPGHPQHSDMGLSDYTKVSDNSNPFQHNSLIILTLKMLEI